MRVVVVVDVVVRSTTGYSANSSFVSHFTSYLLAA